MEPIYQLQVVRDALKHAAETDRMGSDAAFSEFVNTVLGSRLMVNLARERSVDDDVSLTVPWPLDALLSLVEWE